MPPCAQALEARVAQLQTAVSSGCRYEWNSDDEEATATSWGRAISLLGSVS